MYHVSKLYALIVVFTHLAAGLHQINDGLWATTLERRSDALGFNPIRQRLVARGDVHLKMKGKERAAVTEFGGMAGRGYGGPNKDWMSTGDKKPIVVNKKDPRQAAGMMATKTQDGRSSGKIKGPEVRANVMTVSGTRSMVSIKDPSKQYYPTGRHQQILTGPGAGSKSWEREDQQTFRAASNDPNNPAKIKVKTIGKGGTYFEGAPNSEKKALDAPTNMLTGPYIPSLSTEY